jgi:hypothetical protein
MIAIQIIFLVFLTGNVDGKPVVRNETILNSFSATSIAGLIIVALGCLYQWRLHSLAGDDKSLKNVKKPDNIAFCSETNFITLSAICDTFLPSLTTNDCSNDNLKTHLDVIHSCFLPEHKQFFEGLVKKNKKYLLSGAIEYGTPKHVAEAIQQFIPEAERTPLCLILSLLGTSVGTFLLTGYLAPFKVRKKALISAFVIFSFLFVCFALFSCLSIWLFLGFIIS